MKFQKAPVICNTGLYRTYAEGVATNDGDVDTFQYAVDAYSFVLPKDGTPLTGAQWVNLISKSYDMNEPRNKEVGRVINKVMLTEEFKDDHFLVNRSREAIFRGSMESCFEKQRNASEELVLAASAPVEYINQAMLSMVRAPTDGHGLMIAMKDHPDDPLFFKTTYLNLPNGYGVKVQPEERMWRPPSVHRLMEASPVGQETFTSAQNDDYFLSHMLMYKLMTYQGYEAIVTGVDGLRPSKVEGRDLCEISKVDFGLFDMISRIDDFFKDMVERGWDGKSSVFLCRPAPLINPIASIKPHESIVHKSLIGWRLPKALVEHHLEKIKEGMKQEEVSVPRDV